MAEAVSTVTKVIQIDVKASAEADAQIKKIAAGMGEIETAAKKMQDQTAGMFKTMKGMLGFMIYDHVAQSAFDAAVALSKMNDQAKILNARMEQVTGSADSARYAFGELVRISQAQGRELDGVAKLYEKVVRNADNLGVTLKGVSLVTEGFAASLRLSGANTQEANAAMLQFAQALASGKLQGDEFRSILENDAVFMYELAKAAGVTVGALKNLSKEGKIDMEFLNKALFKVGDDGMNMLQRLKKSASEIPMTFDQAFEGVKAGLVSLIDAMSYTADKTEGYFTKMARSVSAGLSEASIMVREAAMLRANREAAKAGAQLAGEKTGPETFDQRYARYEANLKKEEALRDKALARRRELQGENASYANAISNMFEANVETNIDNAVGGIRTWKALLEEMDEVRKREGEKFTKKITGGGDGKTDKPKAEDNWMVNYYIDLQFELLKQQRMLDGTWSKLDKRQLDFEEKLARKRVTDESLRGNKSKQQLEADTRAAMDQLRLGEAAAAAAKFGVDNQKFETDNAVRDMKDLEAATKSYYDLIKTESPAAALRDQIREITDLMEKFTNDPEKIAQLEKVRQTKWIKVDELENNTRAAERAADRIGKAFEGAAETAASAMLDFATGTKASFGDMVFNILRGIAKVELELAMKPGMKLFGEFLRGLGDNRLSPNLTTWSDNANGNAFDGQGIVKFADGGVVNSATGFSFAGGRGVMGEAGPEAIMPLKRGSDGKLGVGTTPVTVNIINNGNNTVSTQESTSADGSKRIDVIINDVVERGIVSGRFDAAMSGSFGASRRGY